MKLGMQVGLDPGHIVLDGDPAALPQRGTAPNFWPYLLRPNACMSAWIKMPLGMEVGLGPGNFVLDGDPAPLPKKGVEPQKFSEHVYCVQTAGWIKMVLGTEVGFSPGDIVLEGDQPPPQKGA